VFAEERKRKRKSGAREKEPVFVRRVKPDN
jgi:hypothetical protein